MAKRGEVLVAIMNNRLDFALANEQHWYRIPKSSVNKWLKEKWPPKILAFYQTKVFEGEAYAIHFYATVKRIEQLRRKELFPNQPEDKKSEDLYYKLYLGNLERLEHPICSRRLRRIVFIPSTLERLQSAKEINDLYHGSSLEEHMWQALRIRSIPAEREEYVKIKHLNVFLDFAIYCAQGKIDVETDGDFWHISPEKASEDNLRDNSLSTYGWNVIRFNDKQIQESLESYCIPTIIESVNRLGGVEEGKTIPRKITSSDSYQPTLFDNLN